MYSFVSKETVRRLTGVILAAALALLCMPVPTIAEGFHDVAGKPYEAAVSYLAENGIVNGRNAEEYAPEAGLTRAEMVAIILRAYGEGEVEGGAFTDVPETHWAFRYIRIAYGMGIINGMTETTFQPDGEVTYEQAVKMLVCAMGDEDKAEEAGGYPGGYLSAAEGAGVLENVDGQIGKPISRGSMAQLVYNSLQKSEETEKTGYEINWNGIDSTYDWIREEKIRALYGAAGIIEEGEDGVVALAKEAGCNTLFLNLIHDELEYYNAEGVAEILDTIVENLPKYNMHTFIKINFGDNGYAKNNEFGNYHPGVYKQSYTNTPDPLSEAYWEKQILERALMIAEHPEFEGIILDYEMYSGGSSSYASPCLCDSCWEKFMAEQGDANELRRIKDTERNDFLQRKDLAAEYKAWFTEKITRYFENVREKVHAVNPDIIFGYMPNFEWLAGITRGLGTPEKPVIVLSENEYWGSLADTKTRMQLIQDEKYPAIYLPGLYAGSAALTPEQLEKSIGLCAPTTAGYWIYAAHKMRENEAYYPALRSANDALDAELENGILTPLPSYEVRSYTARKIEGEEPTEEEWEAAPLTESFVHYQLGEEGTVPAETRAKILYSEADIFVRYFAYEKRMGTVLIPGSIERDGNVWAADCAEIFWKFDDQTPCVHLLTDTGGNVWDAYSTGPGAQDKGVNFEGISAKTERRSDHWEMTVRIPGTMDGVRTIQTGDVLRMELGRYRPQSSETGDTQNMCWAPTYGSYLGSPSLWGYVILD